MNQDSKKIVGVAKAIYERLGEANFSRADVEDLAQKIADKIPFEKLNRSLAVKLVSVGIKAAEAAAVLYQEGSTDAPTPVRVETVSTEPKPEAKTESTEVPPEDVEVMPPKEVQT